MKVGSYQRSIQWIKNNHRQYIDEYIVLLNGTLLTHGYDKETVLNFIKSHGYDKEQVLIYFVSNPSYIR